MLRYLISGAGDFTSYLIQLLLCLPIILFSLSLHETAHGFVAYKCGDPTAHDHGRLTLNPLKHLDPVGFLCMLLAGFGWAKPVPILTRNLRKPRRDIALVSLAGPMSNLLLSFLFSIVFRFTYQPLFRGIFGAPNEAVANLFYYLLIFIFLGIQLNVSLAVFNLLPIPPLDGSKILYMLLPPKVYYKIAPYERYISLVFMLLLVGGVLSPLLTTGSRLIIKGMFWLLKIPDIFGIF